MLLQQSLNNHDRDAGTTCPKDRLPSLEGDSTKWHSLPNGAGVDLLVCANRGVLMRAWGNVCQRNQALDHRLERYPSGNKPG